MKRFNTGYFYKLGWQVHQLFDIAVESKLSDSYWNLVEAKDILDVLARDILVPAPLSKQAAAKLALAIQNIFPPEDQLPDNMDMRIGYPIIDVHQKLREFEPVLDAELGQIETYVLAPKGIFDTKLLVDFPEIMFSDEVRKWLSEQAVKDIQQAGRCLAFELSTAAGFHLARAVEETIRNYYKVVAQKPYDKEEKNLSRATWKNYVDALEKKGVDKKILNALDQMRELHRNPISHPDENLSIDEAMVLVGLAQSAIVAMATDSKRREPQT